MKRILSFVLSLLLVVGCLAGTASAAPSDNITVSFKTAVYSISKETFVRWTSEQASLDECGEDEYITVCPVLTNNSGAAVTLRNVYIRIDGGRELAGQMISRWSRENRPSSTCTTATRSISRPACTPWRSIREIR